MHHITVSYPSTLAEALDLNSPDFEDEMRRLALVKLYELGKISSGQAARALNMTKLDFLDCLAQYQVSYLATDLENDLANA